MSHRRLACFGRVGNYSASDPRAYECPRIVAAVAEMFHCEVKDILAAERLDNRTSFVRGVATLAYDGQTGNFTVGLRVTGTTTGATGIVAADADSGATGTLSLVNVVGTFQDNEAITDTSTGAATVNGTITRGSVTALGSTTQLIAAQESSGATAWDADFAAASGEAKINVTGDTSNTVDWTVRVWPTRSLL